MKVELNSKELGYILICLHRMIEGENNGNNPTFYKECKTIYYKLNTTEKILLTK